MLVVVQLLLPGCSSFQLPSKHSLVSEYLSIPFLIYRTSPLINQEPLLQLVKPSLECLTLALYSPSLVSSSLSSHTLERSVYCAARAILLHCNFSKAILMLKAFGADGYKLYWPHLAQTYVPCNGKASSLCHGLHSINHPPNTSMQHTA